ncbi:MAG: hypothetical protein K940chlam7_01117 [Chlamydiae bacterium]|nr:hypothetical protein [Chlamydiota bacterium]
MQFTFSPVKALPNTSSWPISENNSNKTVVIPLAAETDRITLLVRQNSTKFILKWCYKRKPLSELDINKQINSERIPRLLAGRVVNNASLRDIIPGLREEQYQELRERINALANEGLGENVVGKNNYRLTSYQREQDVLVLSHLFYGSFSDKMATCPEEEWIKIKEQVAEQIGQALEDMQKSGFCHSDPSYRNIGVDISNNPNKKYEFFLLDFGKVVLATSKAQTEKVLRQFLNSLDTLRSIMSKKEPPREGSISQRWRPPTKKYRPG